jgi:hypothetical protein
LPTMIIMLLNLKFLLSCLSGKHSLWSSSKNYSPCYRIVRFSKNNGNAYFAIFLLLSDLLCK